MLPVASGEPRRIPHKHFLTSGIDLLAAWWPDGRHLLLGGIGPGDRHLNLMDVETGASLAFTSGTGSESQAAVAPDGKKIAFTAGSDDLDLLEIVLDGPSVRPLLATGRNEELGAWAPSGTQYVYITDAAGTPEIWLRGVSEGWVRSVLAASAGVPPTWRVLSDPRVSPDGLRVAYDAYAVEHAIWISQLAGGRPLPLDPDSTDQHSASWSPDGNWVAYRRLHEGKWELARIPVGGGKPYSLGASGQGGSTRGGTTDWSPTGEWICHLAPKGLELVSPDAGRRRLLGNLRPVYFTFSTDGATLFALHRSPTRHWQLAAFDVARGTERPTRTLPVPASAGLFSLTRHPDGKRLLSTLSTSRQDIWIMEGLAKPGGWWSRLWRR